MGEGREGVLREWESELKEEKCKIQAVTKQYQPKSKINLTKFFFAINS